MFSNISTVPRKRRPRVAGEVSITSSSLVYLPEKRPDSETGNEYQQQDHVYQNTNTEIKANRENNYETLKLRKGICPFRFKEIENEQDMKNGIESQLISIYMDDSDHHYESLYSMGFPIDKNSTVKTKSFNGSGITTTTTTSNSIKQNHHHHNNRTSNNITSYAPNDERSIIHDEDFDSFDSDGESDEEINKKHDSGVDISNNKLPDPPTSHGYGFMKKIKNFGPLSEMTKSLARMGKKKSPTSRTKSSKSSSSSPNQQQQNTNDSKNSDYCDSSVYYEDHKLSSDYQNTSFNSNKTNASNNSISIKKTKNQKSSKPVKKLSISSSDPYENTEFHSPRASSFDLNHSSSPKILTPNDSETVNVTISSNDNHSPLEISNLSRKKSKKGTSFKSKLRKSFVSSDNNLNIGTALNGTRSTFYISDSVDVDSGIFSGSNDRIQQTSDDSNALIQPPDNLKYSTPKIVPPPRRKNKIQHSPETTRRKSSSIGRPNDPPPPPPPLLSSPNSTLQQNNDKNLKQRRIGTTSWYAECGVFKQDALNEENLLIKNANKTRSASTSWYADAGLYQTSGDSVASSSGSSGVSTGGEGGPGDENSHSMFLNEPLYQIYSAAKLESISREIMEQDQSDGYEEVGRYNHPDYNKPKEEIKKNQRPTALQLIEPKHGPSRTLWSEIPEVITSGILSSLTMNEKKLQEAKFEILTSEASYLKSLNLLRSHFMNHPAFRDSTVLNPATRKCLFANIIPVLECSDRLLSDLESCWQDNIMLLGLSHNIYKNAEKYFHVYISYCEHQGKLDRTLKKLKEQKGVFWHKLEALEADSICCGLSLHSFLMLPMQRITRLPLLIDAVLGKIKATDDEFESWKMTLAILNKTVQECNDAANRCAQAYELEEISGLIEFPFHVPPIPIVPIGLGIRSRTLVRKGELTLWKNDDGKLTFGKKFTKLQKEMSKLYAFLFTDLLVLTKKKADGKYQVVDYCQRSMLTLSSGDLIPQQITKDMMLSGKFWMLMTLLENYDKKTVEMIVSCSSETERQRWLQATEPPESENPDEKLYEQWDCPQVIANHSYHSTQPDEISLDIGDVVNVTRKMADGWYHGERLRDGIHGWFPGNYTEEVASPHVRARNLKQRHRFLVFSANYLESQKKSL